MIHDAVKVAYSSIVGQSIMLLNDKGACIGQLSVINCDNPQEIADEVVAALKAPSRHGYRVGVAVGRAADRAIDALGAAVNTSARRAGFFE